MDTESRRIWFVLWALAFAGVASLVMAWVSEARAQANPGCPSFASVEASLEQRHQVQLSGGFITDSVVLVIYGTLDGSDWTAVIVGTNDTACVIASGSDWFPSETKKGNPV